MIEVAPNVYGYVQGGGVTVVSNDGLIFGNDSAVAAAALLVDRPCWARQGGM